MAKRIHSTRFSLECETHHSGLHMVLHGISLWSYVLLPWVHIFRVTHLHILDKGMVHPIGGVCSHIPTCFCFPPGVHTLKPWSSQYSHTRGVKLIPWEAYHPEGSHLSAVPVRPGAAGLLIRTGYSRVGSSTWLCPTSFCIYPNRSRTSRRTRELAKLLKLGS